MQTAHTFGEWLKRRRGGLGLTQKQLAQQVGYAEVTLRKVEADELRPSHQMAEKLAEALQIAPAQRAQFIRFARDEAGWDEVTLPTQEPSAVPAPVSTPQQGGAVRHRAPLERPPRAEHFQGRKAELHRLLADLQPGRVVTLCGPGGIGKSALAAEAVWQLAPGDQPPEPFPDGILFHSFYNQSQAALALEHIARSFGEEPKPTPKEAARRALAGRRFLLCLDGAEEADDLRQVLDIRDQCGVLVTSRQRRDAIAERQDVAPLPQADAVTLLQAWGGERAADEAAISHISELVGRLPLALRLVGRYLAENEEDAPDYLAWLTATPLAALDQGRRREESIPVLLTRSLAQVSEQARQVMGVIGLLALAPFTWEPIAAALELPDLPTRRALGELVNYGLLSRPAETYEVSHALIHTYARLQMSPPLEVVGRLADHYTALVKKHSSDFARLHSLRPHIMALLRVGSECEAWTAVSDLVSMVDNYLDLQGYWTHRITALEAGLAAARALHNKRDEANRLSKLGGAYYFLGQVEKSIMYSERAVQVAQESGDHQSKGTSLGNLGMAYSSLGQTQKAITYHEQALQIAQEIGDYPGEGTQLASLGNAYRNLAQVAKALIFYEQALQIAKKIGDRRREGRYLGSLGNAYGDLGQVEKSIEYYEQGLQLIKDMGDRPSEGILLGNLGNAYHNLGQVEKAIVYHEQALQIDREIGDRLGEGFDLGHLGTAYRDLGEMEKAIKYSEQALEITKEIGDRYYEGRQLGNLSTMYRELGQVGKAIQYSEQALQIAQEIGDRHGEGNQLCNLGNTYYDLGQIEKATSYHEQALQIAQEIGDRQGETVYLSNLGEAYRDLGQAGKAIEYSEQGLQIARDIGHRRSEGSHLSNLGQAYGDLGQMEKAINYQKQALQIAREIGYRRGESNDLGNLAIAYRHLGQHHTAIEYGEQALIIVREVGWRLGEGEVLKNLGSTYQALDDVAQARQYWEQSLHIFAEIKSPHAEEVRNLLQSLLAAS